MSFRPSLSLLLILIASLALPMAAGAERSDADDARPQGRRFFERFHDFAHFPVGRGRIGVQVQPMTPELRTFMGAPDDRGLLVERVVDGSPAEAAGLLVGDVITEAGGEPVESTVDLIRAIHSLDEGEPIALRYVREDRTDSVEVTPEPASEHYGVLPPGWGGKACEGDDCPHRGHRGRRLERRLDEVEKRLQELEKHVLPGMDNAETAT